jgi:hypothetical protein
MSSAVQARTVLAHLRLASVGSVKLDNAHPFTHGRWAFAHNGTLHAFDRHRAAIEALIAPAYRAFRGDTDSERCFALFLTRLASRTDSGGTPSLGNVQWALATTMDEVARITDVEVGHGKRSAMNFLVTDGDLLAATRRDRTLFFAAEAERGRSLARATRQRHAGVRPGGRQRGAPGPRRLARGSAGRRDRHRPDLTFVETSLATLLQRTAGTLARTG